MKFRVRFILKKIYLFLVLVGVFNFQKLAYSETSSSSENEIDKALLAYDSGDFKAAVKGFEQLWTSGIHNGSLLFNLGNAHYKSGARGAAVAAYLAARDFLPRDAELLANLQYVLNENQDNLPVKLQQTIIEKTLFFWLDSFSLSKAYWMFVALLFLFFVVSAACLYFKSRVVHRYVLLVSFALTIIFGTMLVYRIYFAPTWGAVTAPQASLFSSPTMTSAVLFRLHEGAPVVLRRQQGDWMQVEFGDGKKAWIAAQEVRFYNSI